MFRGRSRAGCRGPHEAIHANIFMIQLLDYCPGNTPKVSNWSRHNPLNGLLTNTLGVFVSIIQSLTYGSVRMDSLVWDRGLVSSITIIRFTDQGSGLRGQSVALTINPTPDRSLSKTPKP